MKEYVLQPNGNHVYINTAEEWAVSFSPAGETYPSDETALIFNSPAGVRMFTLPFDAREDFSECNTLLDAMQAYFKALVFTKTDNTNLN